MQPIKKVRVEVPRAPSGSHPLSSWVKNADGSEFPLENLPMGVFSHELSARGPRIGVALGDMVIDMKMLLESGLLDSYSNAGVFGHASLNAFMARPRVEWQWVRAQLTELFSNDGPELIRSMQARILVPRSEARMHLPASIGDYTDFYSSREHATNVGTMFRGKADALQPNWLHLPVGYHGRASSVVPSGTPIVRPCGQLQLDKTDATKGTEHAPCRLMDFEVEMGFFVGGVPNELGKPISMAEAADRIFGYVLCNDWSARDIQKFEYVPLGPFGAKNFGTTISPWVVMTDALEVFRCATSQVEQTEVVPLPYLRDPSYTSYDVHLTVSIAPESCPSTPTVVSTSNYRHQYWTSRQQLVHHAVTGCNMQAGDLLASGTISGVDTSSYGSMLELCWQGTREVGPLADGSTRKFLKDGDTVQMRGVCKHTTGFKIGFGECDGQVLAAGVIPAAPPPVTHVPPLKGVRLWTYWRSSTSWRVRIALGFYRVLFTHETVNLLNGEQAAVSEMAQVPRLDWTDASGESHSLTQSLAIIELLCDVYDQPGSPSLRPLDPIARSRARQIAEIINSGTHPLQNLSHIKEIQGSHATDVINAREIGKTAIVKGLTAVEALLKANATPCNFCVGAHLSVADCCLVPQLFNARRFGVDLAAFPRALAIEANVQSLRCFEAAHPNAQPDAKPDAAA